MASAKDSRINLPRVEISYCTQCKWMLRAAYFGQELLSTFGTQIGEIALIPSTGGLFQVHLIYVPSSTTGSGEVQTEKLLLWDRKSEGGFPETKVLKQKVRDCIDPSRDLGHSDKGGKKKDAVKEDQIGDTKTEEAGAESGEVKKGEPEVKKNSDGTVCEDCK